MAVANANGAAERPPANRDAVQIIVLTHPAAPVPARLMQALQRRGSRVQLVTDAPMLMAELAFARKPVVIVNQWQRFASLDRLLAAVARYYPSADCWRFDEQADAQASGGSPSPRFTKLLDATAPHDTAISPEAAAAQTPKPAPPPLRIADGDALPDEEDEPLLTAAELAMLLGERNASVRASP